MKKQDQRAQEVSDTENLRQQLLAEIVTDHGPHWTEQYEVGAFGCHELLDRTSLVAKVVDENILTHPACVQNREWFALAKQAVDALNELYLQVGAAHLREKQPRATGHQR